MGLEDAGEDDGEPVDAEEEDEDGPDDDGSDGGAQQQTALVVEDRGVLAKVEPVGEEGADAGEEDPEDGQEGADDHGEDDAHGGIAEVEGAPLAPGAAVEGDGEGIHGEDREAAEKAIIGEG